MTRHNVRRQGLNRRPAGRHGAEPQPNRNAGTLSTLRRLNYSGLRSPPTLRTRTLAARPTVMQKWFERLLLEEMW